MGRAGVADGHGRSPAGSTPGPTRVVVFLGLYALAAGLVSFAGWAADVPRLTSWDGRGISIQANTAVAAWAMGVALVLAGLGRERLACVPATLTAAIGLATLFEHASGVDLGIDTVVMFDRPWGSTATVTPGRMGVPASLSWTLAGTAVLLLRAGDRGRRAASALGLVVMGIAALSVIGYVFGADVLYSLPRLTAIAFQTSTILFAVGHALVAAVPERQPMRGLLEDSAAGTLTRRTLPLVLTAPVLLGLLTVVGHEARLYDTAMGIAMLVLALIAFLCGVLWWGATAVRHHESALSTTVAELEGVLAAAPVGIAVARDRACAQIRLNAAFSEMLGVVEGANASLTGPEAGSLPFRITDEDGRDIAPEQLPLQRAARMGEASFQRTIVIERADGKRVVATGSAVPIEADGKPSGAIAVFSDVTAERRAAAEREELLRSAQQARAEAETANRAKDEFLAILSHELRSPLNAMLGWVRILRRAGTNDELVARAVETLERNVTAQAQLIEDLLDVSRIASGKLVLDHALVDVAGVVAGCVESLRPAATAKHLALELDISGEALDVYGDAARLQQIVGNLVHNAIKFTPEGGKIAVRAYDGGGHVTVEVGDTGEGIAATLLPHVFDRFVQSQASTTRRHGGLGLGLAIVKQLAALHGGAVHAESAGPGRGSRFTVQLPCAAAIEREPVLSQRRGDDPNDPRAHGRHGGEALAALEVLLVEDDPDSREALALALEHAGVRVRAAESVRAALEAYDARPPDVLVSDIGMPDEDGYSLIRAVRERENGGGRRTLAIAITGFASREDHQAALRAGFDEHVGKPVDPETLLERVRVLAASR